MLQWSVGLYEVEAKETPVGSARARGKALTRLTLGKYILPFQAGSVNSLTGNCTLT